MCVFVCNQDNERQLQLEEVSSQLEQETRLELELEQETRLLAAAQFPMERKRETIITALHIQYSGAIYVCSGLARTTPSCVRSTEASS